jgi:hypothetical protein
MAQDIRALVIGINDYPFAPLTSAVEDAQKFAAEIEALGLVATQDITLLTSPGTGATRDQIKAALKPIYKSGRGIKKFFFFFSGHGLLTYDDGAHIRARTALPAADVKVLKDDGDKIIDFDEILELLDSNGPLEQYYFIDACRDLGYDVHPKVGSLGLAGETPEGSRYQVALYAVSKGGKAEGAKDGLGIMTSHLLKALRGEGIAMDFDDASGEFVVTGPSICAYVFRQIEQAMANVPLWTKQFLLADPHVKGPPPTKPLRIIPDVRDRQLTIHVEPEELGPPQTKVILAKARAVIRDVCLPPQPNHATVMLPPYPHLVTVESTAGDPMPARDSVDVRVTSELRIRVSPRIGRVPLAFDGSPPAAPLVDSKKAHVRRVRGRRTDGASAGGILEATALEPATTIRFQGLAPPYEVKEGRHSLRESLRPGPYAVSFRIGTEEFGRKEVFVTAGEELKITPTPFSSQVVRDAIGGERSADLTSTEPSETVGPMQGAVLPTLLPLLGLKAYDRGNTFLRKYNDVIPSAQGDLALVIALDGEWGKPARDLFSGFRVIASPGFGAPNVVPALSLVPLRRPGFERIAFVTSPPFNRSYILRIDGVGMSIQLAVGHLPKRATVIGVVLRPDGSFDVSNNILRIPGNKYDEPVPVRPDEEAKLVRALQIGQKLYSADELAAFREDPRLGKNYVIRDGLLAKWLDPILGCMTYYAGRGDKRVTWMLDEAAPNLRKYFGELADARLIAQLHGIEAKTGLGGAIPVLAESVRLAAKLGIRDSDVMADLARRITPGQPWTLIAR